MQTGASKNLRAFIITVSGVILFAAGLAAWLTLSHRFRISPEAAAPASWTTLASFADNGVAVEIGIQREKSGKIWLAGRFTPERAGFHLYSKDLPRGGIDGLGYPTLLEIAKPGAMRSPGPLQADKPVVIQRIEILDQSFPIYPEGPVTLRLPVKLADNGAAPTEVSISYMACSLGTCLPPVIDKRFWVRLSSTPIKRAES